MVIPQEFPNYFGFKGAIYLFPFFVIGIGIKRFKQQLSNAEKIIDSMTAELEAIEQALSDTTLYEQTEKARLTALLKKQGADKESLERAEIEWMSAQEIIEQMESEFAANS